MMQRKLSIPGQTQPVKKQTEQIKGKIHDAMKVLCVMCQGCGAVKNIILESACC